MMALYSHKGGEPAPLPFRIHLKDGRTRTDPASFTPEELAEAGLVEATAAPAHDPATQHPPVWNGTGWTVTDKTAEELAAEAAAVQDERRAGVLAERARRLAAGFDYNFGDTRGIRRIGTTQADMLAWASEVNPIAAARGMKGRTTAITIKTAQGPVQITPEEWVGSPGILEAAAAFREPIWAAAMQLEAMNPIPADYTSDVYWP